MDAKTYVDNVLITESRDFAPIQARIADIRNIRLIHASAGITSEIAELIDLESKSFDSQGNCDLDRVNLMEECSDILWYVGVACDVLNCTEQVTAPLEHVVKVIEYDDDLAGSVYATANRLAEYAGAFADLAIKKYVFYGKPFDPKPLVVLLTNIHNALEGLLHEAGYTVEQAREINIAKLKARYGAKFTEAAANNRNLEVERKILEGK